MSLLGNCFTNRANLQSCMPGKDNQYPHTLARIRHAHNAVVPVIDTRRVITPRMDAPAVGGSSRGSSRCSGRGSSHGTVGSGKKESSARAAEGVRSAVRPAAPAASHSKRSHSKPSAKPPFDQQFEARSPEQQRNSRHQNRPATAVGSVFARLASKPLMASSYTRTFRPSYLPRMRDHIAWGFDPREKGDSKDAAKTVSLYYQSYNTGR